MWWLRRSIRTISASECRSACAAAIPAKPPPMITTRFSFLDAASGGDNSCRERVSSKAAVILSPCCQALRAAGSGKRAFLSAGARYHLRGRRFLSLGTQLEQPEQNLVSLFRQFIDRA